MEYILLGLGNPEGYEGTRHNVGKDIVKGLVNTLNLPWQPLKKGVKATLPLKKGTITCVISNGFMNETGQDLEEVLSNTTPQQVVLLHDEVDFAPGVIKFSDKKRVGTHKGVLSVAEVLHTETLPRIRVGVGRKGVLKKHVLDVLPEQEAATIQKAVTETLPTVLEQLLQEKR